jgi:tetratricopeptide (TPR) repeat protein
MNTPKPHITLFCADALTVDRGASAGRVTGLLNGPLLLYFCLQAAALESVPLLSAEELIEYLWPDEYSGKTDADLAVVLTRFRTAIGRDIIPPRNTRARRGQPPQIDAAAVDIDAVRLTHSLRAYHSHAQPSATEVGDLVQAVRSYAMPLTPVYDSSGFGDLFRKARAELQQCYKQSVFALTYQYAYAARYHSPFLLDACRFAEAAVKMPDAGSDLVALALHLASRANPTASALDFPPLSVPQAALDWENYESLRSVLPASVLIVGGPLPSDADSVETRIEDIPVPDPTLPYLTRADVLSDVSQLLTRHERTGIPSVIYITGMPGIGKSLIALQYAHRYRSYYQIMLWAYAADAASLDAAFRRFASKLGLSASVDSTEVAASSRRAVFEHLATKGPWLLVLDGLQQLDLLTTYCPYQGHGVVLVTCQESPYPPEINPCQVRVPTLTPADGGQLILNRLGLHDPGPRERQRCEGISQRLDGLPLALTGAAAYIAGPHHARRLTEYIADYERHCERLTQEIALFEKLHKQDGKAVGHASVFVTYTMALQKLMASAAPPSADSPADAAFSHLLYQVARDLCLLCAVLAPGGLPKELIQLKPDELSPALATTIVDAADFEQAIDAARHSGLIEWRGSGLWMHQVVQDVIRTQVALAEQHAWLDSVVRCIGRGTTVPTEDDRPFWELLAPHANRLLEYIEAVSPSEPSTAVTLRHLGIYYRLSGQYDRAIRFLQAAIAWSVRHAEPADPNLLQAKLSLANVLRDIARLDEAMMMLTEVRQACLQENSRPQHFCGVALINMAIMWTDRQEFDAAAELLQEAIAYFERIGLSQKNGIVRAWYNLSVVNRMAGNFDRAVAPIIREMQWHLKNGSGAFQLSWTWLAIADIWQGFALVATAVGEAARSQEALAQAERWAAPALRVREKPPFKNLPDHAWALGCLADIARLRGNPTHAAALYQEAITIYETHGQLAHHGVLAMMLTGLADIALERNDLDRAQALYLRAEPKQVIELPLYARLQRGLAAIEMERGDWKLAVQRYEETLASLIEKFGRENYFTAYHEQRFAEVLQLVSDDARSRTLVSESAEALQRIWQRQTPAFADLAAQEPM